MPTPEPSAIVAGTTGPKTPRGKARVARNAVTHGVYSVVPVLPGVEQAADWEAHRAGLVASLEPVGHFEAVLVERAAVHLWRLRRVLRYETDMAALGQERAAADSEVRRLRALSQYHAPDPQYEWFPRTVFDQRRCLDLLERLLAQPPLPDDAPFDRWERGDLLRAVAANAHHQDVNLGDLTWPGVPPGEPAFRDPWNVGRIRQGIAALAAAAGQPPEMLLADTVAEIRSRLEAADAASATAWRAASDEVARDRRERVLPPPEILDRVHRYEAHLSRQLTTALHELEAAQARRTGRPAPLARLDVSVTPPAE